MVKESNNTDEQGALSADALYRQYRRDRQTVLSGEQADATSIEVRTPAESTLDNQVSDNLTAESLYQDYKLTRASANEQAVDKLVQLMHEQADFSNQSRLTSGEIRQQNSNTIDTATGIEPIAGASEQAVSNDLQQKPAANDSSVFKRLILPAVAAAILGIALIPAILNKSTEPEISIASLPVVLPDDLVQNADVSLAYLEPPSVSAFGFSDNSSTQKSLFQFGVAITEVEIAVRSGDRAKAVGYVQQFNVNQSEQSLLQTDGIAQAAAELGAALHDGNEPALLDSKLNALRNALEQDIQNASTDSTYTHWYNAGRSVESLRLASAYALDELETASVEQAVIQSADINYPNDIQAVAPLFQKLAQTTVSSSDDFEQIAELLSMTENIKALMQ